MTIGNSDLFKAGGSLLLSAAFALCCGAVPANAAMMNTITVTVTASQPGVGEALSEEETFSVEVVPAAPELEMSVSAELTNDVDGDGLADPEDVVTYSYTLRNTGNVTLTGVGIANTHDGSGELPVPIFTEWAEQTGSPEAQFGAQTATLAPGAVAVFQSAYTVTPDDILSAGGTGVGPQADDDIDSSAVASGRYNSASGQADYSSEAAVAGIALDIVRSIAVTNIAEPASGAAVGQIVTYTYTITNDGNVPVSDVRVALEHNGSGDFAAPDPDGAILTDNNVPGDSTNEDTTDNQWGVLGPGDVLTLTATYTVTQKDIDELQ